MASVDQIQGLSGTLAIKPPCRVATTAAITLSGEQTIDGVAVVADDRVLVKNQATASENGIWVADTSAWSRALDFDGSNDVVDGTLVYVAEGTVNADLVFRCTGTNPITPGTTSITFTGSVTFTTMSAFFTTLMDDADAAAVMTTLGLTANGQSLVTAANYAAMRTLLGLVVGTNVQAYDATLASLAGLTLSEGALLTATGADAGAVLAKGTALQTLRMNAGATAPEWAAPIFSVAYDSGNQTISAGGLLTLTHSLGAAPKIVQFFVKCLTAEYNYSIGDVVCVSGAGNTHDTAGINNSGFGAVVNATTITIRFGIGTNPVSAPNFTTGGLQVLTNANWALIVRAYV